jgi:hypothetical protein
LKAKSLLSLEAGTVSKIVGLAIGAFFAFATFGYSADVVYHGSLCHSAGTQQHQPSFQQWGVGNLSTSNVLVVNCGGALDLSQQYIKTVSVIVYDRNPSMDVRCRLTLVDIYGSHYWIGSAASSGAKNSYQELTFAPPVIKTQTIYLQCFIPPMMETKETSYLTTYRIIMP